MAMKALNIIFCISGAIGLANALYGSMGSSEDKLKAADQECRSRVIAAGKSPDFASQTCSCMITKAKNWKASNPDGDYSIEVHRGLAKQCISGWG